MSLIYGRDEEVAAWAAQRLNRPGMARLTAPFVRPFTAIGVERDGEIVGALVFNVFTGPDIEVTLVGDRIWTRAIIRAASHYVFRQLKCVRLTVTIQAANDWHERIAERLGFVREGVVRDKFGIGQDGILMGMLREECRWID